MAYIEITMFVRQRTSFLFYMYVHEHHLQNIQQSCIRVYIYSISICIIYTYMYVQIYIHIYITAYIIYYNVYNNWVYNNCLYSRNIFNNDLGFFPLNTLHIYLTYICIQIDRQIDRQIDKQINRQIERQRDRQIIVRE